MPSPENVVRRLYRMKVLYLSDSRRTTRNEFYLVAHDFEDATLIASDPEFCAPHMIQAKVESCQEVDIVHLAPSVVGGGRD